MLRARRRLFHMSDERVRVGTEQDSEGVSLLVASLDAAALNVQHPLLQVSLQRESVAAHSVLKLS